jgi:hypothetical protein
VARKTSFQKGTVAREARGALAEQLKAKGDAAAKAFAIATAATKKMSPSGKKRMAAQKGK